MNNVATLTNEEVLTLACRFAVESKLSPADAVRMVGEVMRACENKAANAVPKMPRPVSFTVDTELPHPGSLVRPLAQLHITLDAIDGLRAWEALLRASIK